MVFHGFSMLHEKWESFQKIVYFSHVFCDVWGFVNIHRYDNPVAPQNKVSSEVEVLFWGEG